MGSNEWASKQVQKQFVDGSAVDEIYRIPEKWKVYRSEQDHAKISFGIVTVKRRSQDYIWVS